MSLGSLGGLVSLLGSWHHHLSAFSGALETTRSAHVGPCGALRPCAAEADWPGSQNENWGCRLRLVVAFLPVVTAQLPTFPGENSSSCSPFGHEAVLVT